MYLAHTITVWGQNSYMYRVQTLTLSLFFKNKLTQLFLTMGQCVAPMIRAPISEVNVTLWGQSYIRISGLLVSHWGSDYFKINSHSCSRYEDDVSRIWVGFLSDWCDLKWKPSSNISNTLFSNRIFLHVLKKTVLQLQDQVQTIQGPFFRRTKISRSCFTYSGSSCFKDQRNSKTVCIDQVWTLLSYH